MTQPKTLVRKRFIASVVKTCATQDAPVPWNRRAARVSPRVQHAEDKTPRLSA